MVLFKDYVIYLLLIGLCLFAVLSFAQGIATNYGLSTDVMQSDKIDTTAIYNQINETNEDASGWTQNFLSDNTFIALGGLLMFSVWGIIKLLYNTVILMFSLLLGGITNVLGLPPVVSGLLVTILVIGLIFAGWRVLKVGE